MKRPFFKVMGILGITLVFGLGLALTSCEDMFATEAEIIITNDSNFSGHETVTVYIYGDQGSYSLDSKEIHRDQSVSFSVEAGKYRIRVSAGYNNFSYPQDGSTIDMRGTVRLEFTGSQLKRTN
jgi:hypothetical protein